MRCCYVLRLAVFFLISCFSPALALAAEQVVSVHGDLGGTLESFRGNRAQALSSRARTFRSAGVLRLFMDAGGKTVELVLTEKLGRYWPAYFVSTIGITPDYTDVLLLRGTASDGSETVPLAGAVYEQNGVPTLFLDFLSADGTVIEHLTVPLGTNMSVAPVLESTPMSSLPEMACGTDAGHVVAPAVPAPSAATSGNAGTLALRELEIATEADFEYFTAYGSQSNARIAAVMNAADTIYQRDLSIDIVIKSQHVFTSALQPYVSTDSGDLLTEFLTYTNTNEQLGAADAFHLFTGKNIDGSVIGIAYLSVICSAPSFSYGVTQDFGNSTYLVFAHEIGHNLGANHDSSSANVMAPAVSSSNTSFSTTSRNEIANHIAGSGSCMASVDDPDDGGGDDDDDPADPDPREGSVGISVGFDASSNRFSALLVASDAVASDCQGYLMMSSDVTMAGSQTVAWGRKGATRSVGSGKNKKRIAGAGVPLYVQGVYVCPSLGVSVVSAVQTIDPSNATKPKQVTTNAKWIKSTLKAAAKEAKKKKNST